MTGDTPNGRVTTAQFHVVQLETQKEIFETRKQISDMELRIIAKLEPLSSLCKQVDVNTDGIKENEKDIKDINKRSNRLDALIAAGVAIGTALGITVKAP